MKELAKQFSSICSKLCIKIEPSLNGANDLISILSFVAKSPFIPIDWIIDHNIDDLIDNARKYKEQTENQINTTNELKSKFNDIFLIVMQSKVKIAYVL